jgi:hypothetical protein
MNLGPEPRRLRARGHAPLSLRVDRLAQAVLPGEPNYAPEAGLPKGWPQPAA